MSRPLKKPKYNKKNITNELSQEVVEAFDEPCIPDSKTVYKLSERSTNADRTVLYRKREKLVQDFQKSLMNSIDSNDNYIFDEVWKMIIVFEGYTFQTYKGLKFQYEVKGYEIFVNRKENSKSITKSSVGLAVSEALQLRKQGIVDYGPKKLKVFGASYIWAMFKRFGL